MIEFSIILAMAMSLTPILSEWIHIPKKMRAWTTLILIVLLNVGNAALFADDQIIEAIKQGINNGVVAVGIYSTGKNTMQYMKEKGNGNKSDETSE